MVSAKLASVQWRPIPNSPSSETRCSDHDGHHRRHPREPDAPARRISFATATYDDLPPDVVQRRYRATLDWLGSALAGALEPPARMAQRVARGSACPTRRRCSAPAADRRPRRRSRTASRRTSSSSTTSTRGRRSTRAAPVIPAALAVAEREHATGRAFLLAVARRVRGGAAHRRGGQSEPLSLLASRPARPRRSAPRPRPARCCG